MLLPQYSHGPERFRGGAHCPDHHNGIRTGSPDWCCCCDPCLYIRPVTFSPGIFDLASHSCRCVPMLICATFTPDVGSDPCAKVIASPVFPIFFQGEFSDTITYGTGFRDLAITIRQSVWRFYSIYLAIDYSVPIDHVNVTCLQIPAVSFTGVTLGGVTGTISFSEYASSKLPFTNVDESRRDAARTYPISSEIVECNCENAAAKLCVTGRRHYGEDVEYVHFHWNQGLGDRWEYLPPLGSPSEDREIIYLRSDSEGNCYLEFDFEQSGPFTNDWAVPPTSDGDTSKMIAITTCTCELFVQSETDIGDTTGRGRYVTITGGRCANFSYHCGSCRCVPTYLCVLGEVDGVQINSRATWNTENDTYGWVLDDDPTIKLVLVGRDPESPPFSDDPVLACVVQVTKIGGGDFLTPFNQSNTFGCGFELRGEARSEYDDYYDRVNWLWFSSSICGSCAGTTCNECTDQRCGGPPLVLYVDLRAVDFGSNDPEDPYFGIVTYPCDLTVTIYYWQGWDEASPGTPICGYIGYGPPIVCGEDVFRIKVYAENFGSNMTVSREFISGPVFDACGPRGGNSSAWCGMAAEDLNAHIENAGPVIFNDPFDCDPYYKTGSITFSAYTIWCCNIQAEIWEVTVYE